MAAISMRSSHRSVRWIERIKKIAGCATAPELPQMRATTVNDLLHAERACRDAHCFQESVINTTGAVAKMTAKQT
jgi:hypothetical protein